MENYEYQEEPNQMAAFIFALIIIVILAMAGTPKSCPKSYKDAVQSHLNAAKTHDNGK